MALSVLTNLMQVAEIGAFLSRNWMMVETMISAALSLGNPRTPPSRDGTAMVLTFNWLALIMLKGSEMIFKC